MSSIAYKDVCVLGPTGVGKTWLVHSIAGRAPPREYSPTMEDGFSCAKHCVMIYDTAGIDDTQQGVGTVRDHSIKNSRYFIVVMPPRTDETRWDAHFEKTIEAIRHMRGDDFYFVLASGVIPLYDKSNSTYGWHCPDALAMHKVADIDLRTTWASELCVQALKTCAIVVEQKESRRRSSSSSSVSSSSSSSPQRRQQQTTPPPRPQRNTSFRRLSKHFCTSMKINSQPAPSHEQ